MEASMRFRRIALLLGLLMPPRPAFAQTPLPPPPPPSTAAPQPRPGDAFGEEVTLTAKTIVFAQGSANWDSAFDTRVGALKNVCGARKKRGQKPAGPPMTIYTA